MKASIFAKEAKAIEERQKMVQELNDRMNVIVERTIERKMIDSLKEVKLAKKAQSFINKSRNDAGRAFIMNHNENNNSDEEVDYNDAIEMLSVADQLEELGVTDDMEEDEEGPIDVDAMIIDAVGNIVLPTAVGKLSLQPEAEEAVIQPDEEE